MQIQRHEIPFEILVQFVPCQSNLSVKVEFLKVFALFNHFLASFRVLKTILRFDDCAEKLLLDCKPIQSFAGFVHSGSSIVIETLIIVESIIKLGMGLLL
ncbi:hypothetical protein SDC9_194873 [bioreactor metagenome]|uniref:Uncharacterized protein n=1 Tax=bioreactor metagenome TaxID=1076179 RepID=A0A645I7H7_9ZZZZ